MGDFRYALRALTRDWGFALTFIVTLGLGIGANTAIFSVVNGVLLRPLPYPDADRIVRITQPALGIGVEDSYFSFVETADLRTQADALDEVVEYGDWTFSVLGRGEPHRVTVGLVTANFFDVLGMRPLHGRLLADSDRARNAPPTVVLSHAYWQSRFDADPAVVGQALDLTALTATIVGVLEPGAHYATERELDLYANYSTNDHYNSATMQDDRAHRMTEIFGRLAHGVTLAAAQDEASRIAERLHTDYPDAYPAELEMAFQLTPWRDQLVAGARQQLWILFGTAFSVLMIACANVANLTLTRLVRRDREIAVRRSLGASGWQVRRLMVVESAILALSGSALGLALAYLGLDVLTRYAARFTARTGEIGMDFTVLLFTLAVAVGIALLFGLIPSAGAESRLSESLSAGGGHATAGRQRRLVQRLLVVGQVAVCFMLLVATGLLLRTLVNLYSVDTGFDMSNVLSLEVPTFGEFDLSAQRQFSRDVVAQIGSQPNVDGVTVVGSSPLGGAQTFPVRFFPDAVVPDEFQAPTPTVFEAVTPQYFETLGIELLSGRVFTEQDNEDTEQVAVLSASMAAYHFGDESSLGRQISYAFGPVPSDPLRVVGVVADARLTEVTADGVHAFYTSQYQGFPGNTVLVRTNGDAASVTPGVVQTLRGLDADRPIEEIRTLAELRDEAVAPQRLNATLFGAFAAIALAISIVGIAGVLAFSVSQRKREMGIRVALGAERRRVQDLVLREGVLLTLGGVVAGFAGAVFVAQSIAGLLYGVESSDAPTFVMVALALIAAGLFGAWMPARRAAAVDPIEALRSD
ncbi:MAG: FtsX-like permease family protein [Acidobacteria bacterium]|nr:FtsX-like permease family protein [Acidobacteriota bacterium]